MPKLSKADQKRKISITEANRRKAVALAKLREIELAEKQGQVARIDDITEQFGKMVISAKNRLLGMASKLAPVVAIESDPAVCEKLIQEQVYEALTELANYKTSLKRKTK